MREYEMGTECVLDSNIFEPRGKPLSRLHSTTLTTDLAPICVLQYIANVSHTPRYCSQIFGNPISLPSLFPAILFDDRAIQGEESCLYIRLAIFSFGVGASHLNILQYYSPDHTRTNI